MIRLFLMLSAAASMATASVAQDFPVAPPVAPLASFAPPLSDTFTLANGMRVTLIPFGNIPQATISLQVYAGNLNADMPWIANLTGEMIRQGGAGLSAGQVAEKFANMGGQLNVNAAMATTTFDTVVLSSRAASAVTLLGALVQRPTFSSSEFAQLRDNRARSLALSLASAQSQAEIAMARALYGASHPYGSPLPAPAEFAKYSLSDIEAFYGKNFGARRAHLYVAGRFDTAAVKVAVEKVFGSWRPGPDRILRQADTQPGPKIILIDRPSAVQSTIRIAFPAAAAGSSGDFPMKVMDSLLAGSSNSRFMRNLREDKGYTYSPRSRIDYHPREGMWSWGADVTSSVTGASLHEIFEEIRKLQNSSPDEVEAGQMRAYRASDALFLASSPTGIIQMLGEAEEFDLPADYVAKFVSNALGVSADQLRDTARLALPLDKMTLVIVGDLKTVVPQLRSQPELKIAKMQIVQGL